MPLAMPMTLLLLSNAGNNAGVVMNITIENLLILSGNNSSNNSVVTKVDILDVLLLSGRRRNRSIVNRPDGILEGYRKFFLRTPEMFSTFTGGIFLHDSPDGTKMPNLVVSSLASVPHFNTSRTYWAVESLNFTIWHRDPELARQAGTILLRNTDIYLNLLLKHEYVSTFIRRRSGLAGDDMKGNFGNRMYRFYADYDAYVSKTL